MLTTRERIKQRRLQILVHSYIYYELDQNIISDATWSRWAKELCQLQKDNPDISKSVEWYDAFKDFDGSTGAFLPLNDAWVQSTAEYLLRIHGKTVNKPTKVETNKNGVMRLF